MPHGAQRAGEGAPKPTEFTRKSQEMGEERRRNQRQVQTQNKAPLLWAPSASGAIPKHWEEESEDFEGVLNELEMGFLNWF